MLDVGSDGRLVEAVLRGTRVAAVKLLEIDHESRK